MKLSLERVKKSFSDFAISLDLTINSGEMVTLLGPSGCGKTTTLQLIAGILTPDSGKIALDNKEITFLPPWERNIGLVFQDYALFPHLTVYENILYGLHKKPKKEKKRKASHLLDLVELPGYEDRYPEQLSGGEKQRVALARALAPDPWVLLLDEPLSALDTRLRILLRRAIKNIQQDTGITTVYVTHDQEEALTISDRIALINSGQIIQIDKPKMIYSLPTNIFSAGFLGASNLIPCRYSFKNNTSDNTCSAYVPVRIQLFDTEQLMYAKNPWRENNRADSRQEIMETEQLYLFFRPEDLIYLPDDYSGDLTNSFTGKIFLSEYYGSHYMCEIDWQGFIIKGRLTNEEADTIINNSHYYRFKIPPEKCRVIQKHHNVE